MPRLDVVPEEHPYRADEGERHDSRPDDTDRGPRQLGPERQYEKADQREQQDEPNGVHTPSPRHPRID